MVRNAILSGIDNRSESMEDPSTKVILAVKLNISLERLMQALSLGHVEVVVKPA